MKVKRALTIIFLLITLQSCSSVSGPVHFYPGKPQAESETARIKVPAEITVTRVDGKPITIPSKDGGNYNIYLLPGLHRVEFKYELFWGDNDSGMLIRSDEVGVETLFYAGKTYDLVYKVPTDEDDAYDKVMASNFGATLVEQGTGRQVASRSLSELNEFRLTAKNVTTSQNVVPRQGIPDTTERQGEISVPGGIDAETAIREDAVKRLKFWWLMANEKERQQFREWMKSVDMVR